ncbi:unnamed protein product [Microthlaspi erraticum]|uniref:Uncharacterized protein n=1 Tax=Microthlaspi erraticum TaxID=1685480 RepID=A0A6D2JBG5_9BRAS|nr:unnamed protein product [Microthlaspi erraticum]
MGKDDPSQAGISARKPSWLSSSPQSELQASEPTSQASHKSTARVSQTPGNASKDISRSAHTTVSLKSHSLSTLYRGVLPRFRQMLDTASQGNFLARDVTTVCSWWKTWQ